MSKQRELFEKWFSSKWTKHALTFKYDLTYVDEAAQDAWVIWQAAIASVVVELPDYLEVDSVAYYAELTEEALKNAGIKWTE